MIVDCFPFFNELDLLEIRLNILSDVVDKFVIVEASKTQTLLDKPFNFEKHQDRFWKFSDRIVYVKVEDCPSNHLNLWTMENFQRDAISRGLEQIALQPADYIMISDCDEIPNPEALKNQIANKVDIVSFNHSFHAYYLNFMSPGKNWYGTVLAKFVYSLGFSPQGFRNHKDYLKHVDGGWHFSWLGGIEKIREKALSCIEPFDKSEVPSLSQLQGIFKNRVLKDGFFNVNNLGDNGTILKKVTIDESFPEYIRNNQDKYPHLIL